MPSAPIVTGAPRANVLLVDDRPENLVALEAVLEGLGPNLVRASSGREALRHLLEEDFALVVLDVQMPDMDGFETAALIRARERSRETPILFLTAICQTEEHVSMGYSVGGIDYVFKPFDPDMLRAKVAPVRRAVRADARPAAGGRPGARPDRREPPPQRGAGTARAGPHRGSGSREHRAPDRDHRAQVGPG